MEAVEIFTQLLVLGEINADKWRNKGITLQHLGDYLQAHKCFDEGLKLDKNNINLLHSKTQLFIEEEKYEEVIKHCNDALKINPAVISFLINKGFALRVLKKNG